MEPIDVPRPPLPSQPSGVPWPTRDWPKGPVPDGVGLDALLDRAMDPDGPMAHTRAVVVVQGGRLVAERYGGRTDSLGLVTGEDVTPATPLLSWSMAKSMLHAAFGVLAVDGRLPDLDDPAPVPAWADPADPRHAITMRHLLAMRDGLDWEEEYDAESATSHVVDMLFGSGADDVAGYACARPGAHEPGTVYNYSSGTSNILAGVLGRVLGGPDATATFLRDRLFGPLGMGSADPRFDAAGTWIASSYVYATARDMARFGMLYLRDGVWDGQRLLPDGWVDDARTPRSVDPDEDDGRMYGAHWWVQADEHGTFWAAGYEGQSINVVPALDLVFVRIGKSTEDRYPAITQWRRDVVAAFADAPVDGQPRTT